MRTRLFVYTAIQLSLLSALCRLTQAQPADLIFHNGKIVTVDKAFSIQEAMAVKGNRIVRVGKHADVLKAKGDDTRLVDLQGKTVLPGLIDSHSHAPSAAVYEFDHPVPEMDTIQDVLDYIQSRADALDDGEWIIVQQVFITRLREQRYPTREELDRIAPKNPVVFRTGPDASLNTLALRLSAIDKDFKVDDGGPGYIERDAKTSEPTGILRGCNRYIKSRSSGKQPGDKDRYEKLVDLFKDYNAVGITGVGDKGGSEESVNRYKVMLANGDLTVRVAASYYVDTIGPIEEVLERVDKVAKHPLRKGDPMLRIIGVKAYLDGGMLTGSAYMREPWGVSKIYAIDDPEYRGVLFIPKERLLPIVRRAIAADMQFTAHSVGDGAVHALLDVYYELGKEMDIRAVRPCISHSNFMSREAVEAAARLGVVLDIQPAWLYLDTRTLTAQCGYERLRYFQPLRSIFEVGGIAGGGSDHMQKIGSLRSINPYNPFLGMWITMTRKAKWYDGVLHPEETLTREQAIRFYTINNAYIVRQDDLTGSLEEGKLADFIILDTDILTCPVDAVKDIQVLQTYVDGRLVFERE